MQNKPVTYAVKLILVAAILGIGYFFGMGYGPHAVAPTTSDQVVQGQGVSVMIDFGDGTIKSFQNVPLGADSSVFSALKSVADKNALALDYKDYGGELGVFINSIGGKKGTKDMWWQYWVNTVYSQKGVSSMKVKAGDVIEFKLVKGQQ